MPFSSFLPSSLSHVSGAPRDLIYTNEGKREERSGPEGSRCMKNSFESGEEEEGFLGRGKEEEKPIVRFLVSSPVGDYSIGP